MGEMIIYITVIVLWGTALSIAWYLGSTANSRSSCYTNPLKDREIRDRRRNF